MDELIARATESIDQLLESSSPRISNGQKSRLFQTHQLLNRLHESDSSKNDWTRLFCRQLKRLMDYNESLLEEFWIRRYDDILYILEKSDGEQGMDSSSNRFLEKMNFERKLEQRELQFYQFIGKQKSLSELFYEHKEFFEEYLQKCIDFHSKVQMQGLVENIDDLLYRIYGLTKVSLTLESRQLLSEKLKCIEIPLNCSNRSLYSVRPQFFTRHDSSERAANNDPSNFLPSQRIDMNSSNESTIIENALGCNRWIVVLGDPGSAKTTLLRWIACVFAEAAHRSQEQVDLEGHCCLPIRIPIFIRIGELAAWINQHQKKTLMDYIGEHTWFSERYCDDRGGNVLKQLIYHGHALILLDGLDEISEIGRRGEIVDLVEKFVDEYIREPDFTSAFDGKLFAFMKDYLFTEIIEKQPPSKSGGNQIVVTSRIVGYQFHPLNDTYIRHYTLSLMDHQEANEFIKKWMQQVEKSIRDVLLNQGIELDREAVKTSSKTVHTVGKVIFENSSELLKSNPSLLSLICTFIFQSSTQFHPKSRVQVYNHAVQAALRAWKIQESTVSESVLNNFLIDLAIYLHLQSSSGLIDAFDIEHLCCLTLKQQGVSNNRTRLHEYANKIISLLESNIAIVTERGLQVFGFLHLSFQEYFVAQALIRGSDIEQVAKRILSFTINSRFRESLLLALGWISWKWPFHEYDKFCNFLVTQTENHKSIPFGTLLLFDGINDVHRLPSNSIIFIALNNLLNHPSDIITRTYLISSLSTLPKDTIVEWMQLYLQDEKYLGRFCQYFPMEDTRDYRIAKTARKLIPSVIYQQLWTFHNRSSPSEFLIDQILRRTMVSADVPDPIFNKDLSAYLLSHSISVSNIHPLIASVITAVCGGIFLKCEEDLIKIHFSPKRMYRESSILALIIKYFDKHEEPHATEVQTLIEHYESVLQKSAPSDHSVDIVDTFIALICLQGLSQPLIYEKYAGYQALPLALDRLRRTWFYFKRSCKPSQSSYIMSPDISFMISEIESITNVFLSQFNQSEEQHTSFSAACATAWKKLGMCEKKLDWMANDIDSVQILQQDPFFLLTFLPQPLQQLYYYTSISPTNKTDSLPLVVFLSQCLTYYEDIENDDLASFPALSILQPLFKEYMLENYASVLFWKINDRNEIINKKPVDFWSEWGIDGIKLNKETKDDKLLDPSLINRPKDLEMFIIEECQRINKLKVALQNEEKDLRLFAASISLARLFQAKYCSQKYRTIKDISLTPVENQVIHTAITNILDPVLRIIALSIILDMKDPLVFDLEQRDHLRCEMISLLQSLLPHLSLLTSTLLFIRCYTTRHVFPVPFQHMASVIGNKFNEYSSNKQGQEQEAAYIALRYLNNSDFPHYLSEFTKRKKNLSDLLQFNSTIFHQYFIRAASFDSSYSILLSLMYLVELAFDAQILNMYTITTQKNKISSLTELRELWNDSSKVEKIMTFPVALWITNCLHTSTKEEIIDEIIKDVSCCLMMERKALPLIEKWLDYRMNEDLRFFAHYAALQLVVEGSSMSILIDIIKETFRIDHKFRLKSVVKCLFTSQFVNLTVLHQILVTLHRNIRYYSKISVLINRKETLKLILNLELDRITSNLRRSSETSTTSFLLLIKGCSEDLQVYLVEHLHEFVNTYNEVEDNIKEEYVAIVIKWIIEILIGSELIQKPSIELYNYIFVLLHDRKYALVQKAIVKALHRVFFDQEMKKQIVFLQDDAIVNLEKVICPWNTYSEGVVAVCLLAYGNCLLRLRRSEIVRNISDEMTNVLTNLSETSSSEIISIRADFCLIFAQQLNQTWHTIPNGFGEESNITCEKRYRVLLQQTLYKVDRRSFIRYENKIEMSDIANEYEGDSEDINEIVEHIVENLTELIDTFINDLYSFLCNNLSDPAPNYIAIALALSQGKSYEFRSAIQNSFFGEENFKIKLCVYGGNNSKDIEALIKLYFVFDIVSVEFLDMLEQVEDDKVIFSFDLNSRKLESDPVAMEKLFWLINLTSSEYKFEILLFILRCVSKADAVSFLEVHQKVSLINNVLYDDEKDWGKSENSVFQLLSSLSCFQKYVSWDSERIFFTATDIDEAFGTEMRRVN